MAKKNHDIDKHIIHWRKSSDENFVTMHNLYNSKDYDWALFLGHIVLEKLIKGLYVEKNSKHPLFTHDLLRLMSFIDIELPEDYEEWLDEITTFNINARYDNYKNAFKKRCTKEFTDIWLDRIKELREWLIKQY